MPSKPNRGPSAAAENRAALVAAARDVFGEHGVDAPLSRVAREAGVGQGSLYRHFPTRVALAYAVLDENTRQVEDLARQPGSTLREVTDLITHQIEGNATLISRTTHEGDPELRPLEARIEAALAPKVAEARATGLVAADVTVDDILLAVGLLAALAARVPVTDRHARVEAAWELLMRGLAPRA